MRAAGSERRPDRPKLGRRFLSQPCSSFRFGRRNSPLECLVMHKSPMLIWISTHKVSFARTKHVTHEVFAQHADGVPRPRGVVSDTNLSSRLTLFTCLRTLRESSPLARCARRSWCCAASPRLRASACIVLDAFDNGAFQSVRRPAPRGNLRQRSLHHRRRQRSNAPL